MKRLYSFIMLLAVALSSWAVDVGDLAYGDINSSTKTLTCTGLSTAGKGKSNLNLVVPESIYYNGSTYTVTNIKVNAFAGCTNIRTAEIKPSTVYQLAFQACTSLNKVTLGPNVRFISADVFSGCSNMASIYVDDNNPKFSAYRYALMDKAQTTLIYVPENGGLGTNNLPKTCTAIGARAYLGNRNITHVTLPFGVKTIGAMAFYDCPKVTSVDLPSSITTIGGNAFMRSSAITEFWINNLSPISINASTMFTSTSGIDLKTPRGKSSAYKNAGWTGFKSYNEGDTAIVPYDYSVNTLCFTVTSTKPDTINDRRFDGRAMVVRGKWNNSITWGSATVPPSITIRGKEYAVTRIDNYAFNLNVTYELRNCENVDTVGEYAFYKQKVTSAELPNVRMIGYGSFMNCKSLKSVKWGLNLKLIDGEAFKNSTLASDVIIPPGCYVESYAFEGVKSKKLVIPSIYGHSDKGGYKVSAFHAMTSLDTLVMNNTSSTGFYFVGTPASCKVFVPLGTVNRFKTYANFKNFTSIEEGAYDLVVGDNPYGPCRITITEQAVNGLGEAAYVYNPHVKSSPVTNIQLEDTATVYLNGSSQRYVTKQIGERCFEGSNAESVDMSRMTLLNKIGDKAFYNTQLRHIRVHSLEMVKIGLDAFSRNSSLRDILIDCNLNINTPIFRNNADDFVAYFKYTVGNAYSILGSYSYGNGEECSDHIGLYFVTDEVPGPIFPFGALATVEFDDDSGIKAYAITEASPSTGVAQAQRVDYVYYKKGALLTGVVPGKEYLLKPKKRSTIPSSSNNMLVAADQQENLYNLNYAYYWSNDYNKFVAPSHSYNVYCGQCYLKAPGNATTFTVNFNETSGGKKGDVNGDGTVDVTDVNLTINVMLGKATKAQYPAADVNGDGTVDVTDVNLIINVMLGK